MISRACYVTCDHCGNPADISCSGAKDARRIARGEGFARVEGEDLCPTCQGYSQNPYERELQKAAEQGDEG